MGIVHAFCCQQLHNQHCLIHPAALLLRRIMQLYYAGLVDKKFSEGVGPDKSNQVRNGNN